MTVHLQTPESLDRLVEAARSGDPMASAKLAMRVHRSPSETQGFGLNAQYPQLLANCFHCNDPEFLIAVGEELSKGKLLARDGRFSARFYEKADRLSPFMGAYMMARVVAGRNPVLTKRFLSKAIAAGHQTSELLRQRLVMARLKWVYALVKPMYVIRDGLTLAAAIKDPKSLRTKYWRYKDVLPEGILDLDTAMGDDRTRFFERERESSVSETSPQPAVT